MRDWIVFYVLMTAFWVSWVVAMVYGIVTWPERYKRAMRAAEEKSKKPGA